MKQKQGDTVLLNKLAVNKEKLAKANETYNLVSPYLSKYDQTGADYIAKLSNDNGWLQAVAISKIKDAARNANDFLVLEA